ASEEAESRNHAKLMEILGPDAVVPDALRDALNQSKPGERVYEDLDKDGDPDVVTYLDPDKKHTKKSILVRVLDDDDDLVEGQWPDHDNDCYVADWNGDGAVDRVLDWWDDDGDGDADRMDIYYRNGAWFKEYFGLIVIRDVGDDDRMWYTEDYEYQQPTCQWKTDFNGDEVFSMYHFDFAKGHFVPRFEDPFAHYDIDGDGLAEITVRGNGAVGPVMQTLRYSFDVDNDTHWLNRRDYDFSFNCRGPVNVEAAATHVETLRDGSTCGPYVPWDTLCGVMEAAPWKVNRFCWDEIDNNVQVKHKYEKLHERWEGVGGYPMTEGNKRWETDGDYSGKMKLYYSEVDRRIHLLGAERAETKVDYDFDNKVDAILGSLDRDADGHFETWTYDADADGTPERTYEADPKARRVVCRYPDLTDVHDRALEAALMVNQAYIDTVKAILGDGVQSDVETWYVSKRPTEFYNPEKLLWSREATRYYQDLIREELHTALLTHLDANAGSLDRTEFEAAYARGAYAAAGELIARQLDVTVPDAEAWFDAAFPKRVRLSLINPSGQDQPSAPVVVPMDRLQDAAPDFNPRNFVVTDTHRGIVIREYPSQADDLDGDGVIDEIVFPMDFVGTRLREC
ncbi:MAG: DUF4861 domain-containing protein, partial [bacterium]|nr:DUF4861 domain-containing protein [bacterium]